MYRIYKYRNITFILLMWCKAAVYLHYDVLICSKLTDLYINIPDNSIQWWRRGVDDGGGSGSGNHMTINNVKNQHRNIIVWVIITSEVAFKSPARGWSPPSYIYLYLPNTQNTTRTVTLSSSPSMTFTIHQATVLSPVFIGKDKTARACPIVIVIVTCASSPSAINPVFIFQVFSNIYLQQYYGYSRMSVKNKKH